MKFILALLSFLGIGLFFFLPTQQETTKLESTPKEKALIQSILKELADNHYQVKPIDDAFSKEVYDGFLALIDPDKKFLTQKDIAQLKTFQTSIDDEAKSGDYHFFNKALALQEAGMAKAEKYCFQLLKQDLDSNSNEQFETDGKKQAFASDNGALENQWKKRITYKVIENLYELESQQKQTGESKAIKDLKKEATEQASKFFRNQFDRLKRVSRTKQLGDYLNIFMTLHGPHNGYLTPADKEKFDMELSKSLKGIGAQLVIDKDQVKFQDIIAGGPASKNKDLAINDILLKVTQDGEAPVDITGYAIEEIVPLLRGEVDSKVTLTIKKPDGLIKDVSLIRDVIVMEAGLARSFVLEKEKLGEKIGYIRLPRFYIDFSNDDGPRCSKDIYAEVEKLKKSQVKGIIFDLRFNQGGSLRETLKILGTFIEKGPLVQREATGGKLRTLEDKDESVQYDGEIIVLVNKNSGSASELFSGTLQDYDRAVIVGSPSTFGKGTIQRMRNLDQTGFADSTMFPLGQLKITIGKFYRVSGASTQLKGVEPDIVLPDNYTFINIGEKAQKFPLPWTEIDPLTFSQNVNTNPNLEKVVSLSKKRVEQNERFQLTLENAKRWKAMKDQTLVDLNYKKHKQVMADRQAKAALYESIFSDIQDLKINNNAADLPAIQSDPLRQTLNKERIASIQKDAYIEECLYIMHDLLTQE